MSIAWVSNLSRSELRKLEERARQLDGTAAGRVAGGRMRIAVLAGGTDPYGSRAGYDLAYQMGRAGHVVWLLSCLEAPSWLPADFRQYVQWVAMAEDHPLPYSIPPADLVVATHWRQLPGLYQAHRPCAYLEPGHEPLFDPDLERWRTVQCDPVFFNLPARVLVLSESVGAKVQERTGRRTTLLPTGTDADQAEGVLREVAQVAQRDPLRSGRPRISLCMIAKNEEAHIQRCLASTWGVVDEICLVDTGSTDSTIKLAEYAGAKVEVHPWEDDFAASRNYSLAMASGDWILQLDADEALTPELRECMPELTLRKENTGYLIPIDSRTPGGMSRNYGLRLFRRVSGLAFAGRVHETVSDSLTPHKPTLNVISQAIFHVGYLEDPILAVGKRARNKGLLLRALEEHPHHPRYEYYLAVEEFLAGDPCTAIALVQGLAPHTWLEGEPANLEVECYQVTGRPREALAAAVRATARFPRSLSLWAQQGMIAFSLGDLDACRAAVKILADPPLEVMGDRGVFQAHGSFLLGCMAEESATAEQHWRTAAPRLGLAMRPLMRRVYRRVGLKEAVATINGMEVNRPGALRNLVQALIDLQEWQACADVLERMPKDEPLPAAGSLFWNLGHTEDAIALWQQAGGTGWIYYGIVAALFGDAADLQGLDGKVPPLVAMGLADLQCGEPSWRLTQLISHLVDLGSIPLREMVLSRAPFLSESVAAYVRLHADS